MTSPYIIGASKMIVDPTGEEILEFRDSVGWDTVSVISQN